ncbi:MAG: beta-ketoacyl-[acyl-carrier-protein] synthase family protein [Candidatus Rokubacteria bacterium]|nr:beta-ketoacyl-[acyl-carrier-protein] synthase family protein [Candidatus Rokubacteria bacterium]
MTGRRRVVVTGMGLVSAVGIGVEETWEALIAGRSGVRPIASSDAASLPIGIGAQVTGFAVQTYVANRKIVKLLCKGEAYGLAAAKMALESAGAVPEEMNPARGGVYLGCTKETGPPERLFAGVRAALDESNRVDVCKFGVEGAKHIHPLCLVEGLPNACLYYISEAFHLQGANSNIITSGAASAHAIGEAFRAIQHGESDYVVAGGFDSWVDWLSLAGVRALGLLSTRNHEPAKACRPFDRTRDGSVLGEGAGILLLEALDHARARGAKIHAELVGYATTTDAYKILTPRPDGVSLAAAISGALADAAIVPDEVDYVNAYGSGTILGDKTETLAIKTALGKHAHGIPVSSIKPVVGHLVGASGAVELIASVLAIERGRIPPTINYAHPDPVCDLDYVPNKARDASVDVALSISRGFGGQNVALVARAFAG